MPKAFDPSHPPFDRLSPQEVEEIRAAIDIAYFPPAQTVIDIGAEAEHLFVVISGHVEEIEDGEAISLLGPGDVFDSRALVHGGAGALFQSKEEVLCYLMPRELILDLIQRNPRFGAFFYLDISRKLDAHAREQEEQDFGALMRTRVKEIFLHPADIVPSTTTIAAAGRRMAEIGSNALLVQDGERRGIITGMNLSKAMILRGLSLEAPVAEVTKYDLVVIGADDFLSSALILMTRHNKRRLVVEAEGEVLGFLEDIDLLGVVAGNAQVLAGRFDRAQSIEDLAQGAHEMAEQIRRLHRQNVRIETIMEIASDLNRRLFARTFELLAPESIKEKGCLIVMGSEGRREQTLRTDQDNGLILAEPVPESELAAFQESFTQALEAYGFPPCPGNVMVRNPQWSQTVEDYKSMIRRWIMNPDEESAMNLAIFFDASAVAGQAALLNEAKQTLVQLMQGEQTFIARFARAADSFETPLGMFNNLITGKSASKGALDLKKGGIFPLVHGVRALAIEKALNETSTTDRIERLIQEKIFERDFGEEMIHAFQFLSALRLTAQFQAMAEEGKTAIRPRDLSNVERDLLRDALRVVKTFKEVLRRHFNLTVFS